MNMDVWNKVRTFYHENFGVSENLVDLVASSHILLLCVSGTSNDNISKSLDVDLESLTEVLSVVLDFGGWSDDMDINPYAIFINNVLMGHTLFKDFKHEVNILAPHITDDDVKIMFRICRIYSKIEDRIDGEWV